MEIEITRMAKGNRSVSSILDRRCILGQLGITMPIGRQTSPLALNLERVTIKIFTISHWYGRRGALSFLWMMEKSELCKLAMVFGSAENSKVKIFGAMAPNQHLLTKRYAFNSRKYFSGLTRTFHFSIEFQFHILLNLAVGGTNGFFPDSGNESEKPWLNSSPQAATDFWNGRDQWLPGWNLDKSLDAALIVDSVHVWAL